MAQHPTCALRRLRNDNTLTDGIIRCENNEIPVHLCVVSQISSYFATAFTGPFREAASGCLSLENTTTHAVHVLLDYAYEVQFFEKLLADDSLTVEVWELAHMCDVQKLQVIVEEAVVAHVQSGSTCIAGMLNCAEQYMSNQSMVNELYGTAAKSFSKIDWKLLRINQLRTLLRSHELVATEWTRVRAVREWCMRNKASNSDLVDLVSLLKMELLEYSELCKMLDYGSGWIPHGALVKLLKEREGFSMRYSGDLSYYTNDSRKSPQHVNKSNLEKANAISVAVAIPAIKVGRLSSRPRPVFFRIGHFVLSLAPRVRENRLNFRVQVERLWSETPEGGSLAEVLKGAKFYGYAKLAGCEGLKFDLTGNLQGYRDRKKWLLFKNDLSVETASIDRALLRNEFHMIVSIILVMTEKPRKQPVVRKNMLNRWNRFRQRVCIVRFQMNNILHGLERFRLHACIGGFIVFACIFGQGDDSSKPKLLLLT